MPEKALTRRGRPFVKGDRRAGRPKGARNKATREMKEIALGLTVKNPRYMSKLKSRLESGRLHPTVEVFILAHAVGKPAEKIDLTTQEVAPLVIDRVTTREEMLVAIGRVDPDAGDDDDE